MTTNQTDQEYLKDKMNKYVDSITHTTSGHVKVAHPSASMTNNSYKSYRSSFLTLSDLQIPNDYREIFRWCRYFFKFDPLIGAGVRSLATFPVTDWILNDTEVADDKDTKEENKESEEASDTFKFYENVLSDINLYHHMIEIGYDYFLYGNCIIFAEPGIKEIKRRDPETGTVYVKKEVVWKSIERLDVTRLRIDKDMKTGEKVYFYDIPTELKRVIQTQKPKEKYDKIPKIFKDAVKRKGLVKLKSEYVYPFQMPSESGDNSLWATPPILHVMKLILYSNVLRQAQEAIAYEHIIPKRIYYFSETTENSPNHDFASVADDFARELKKQLNDPNYQIIAPIPIQQIQHGGQGKALLLVPELEQLQETILAGMGCPREFVFGGVSYSGSTTSLRILENHFITYRTAMLDYINDFLIKRLAELRGEWETVDDDEKLVKVSLSELKMQDDIQQKQLMINLNSQGKLPDEVMYDKVLGLDSTKIIKQLQAERMRKLQEQKELQLASMEQQRELEQLQIRMGMMPTGGQEVPNAPIVPEPAPGAFEGQPEEEMGGEGMQEGAQAPEEAPEKGDNREAMAIAQEMLNLTEAAQANVIAKLPQKQAQRVMMYYNQLKSEEEEEVDMTPYPTQLPPRREGGV